MKKGNIISSILIIITSLFFFFNTFGFTKLANQIVGADFMPRMYVFLLIILSIILIIQSYRKREEEKEKVVEEKYLKYSIITMLILLGYIILIPIIGFYISTISFVLIILYFAQVKNKIILMGIPIFTSLFIYVFFKLLLNVSMPAGLIF